MGQNKITNKFYLKLKINQKKKLIVYSRSVAIIANLQKCNLKITIMTSSTSLSTTKTYYTAWHHFFSSHGNMAPFCYKIIPLLLQFPTFPPLSSHAQPFIVSTSKHCPSICIANPAIKNISQD
ncbi:hypothetical protein BpHYR1_049753 [Brachionus plicatilis]|uniref:Uncharacterized protein n=1 Tax=Brachionus plicatilis TaxID=10195 RepID=A0A3M7Q6G0_BRAPC|nr:hypothetical protein BpHYR1_049753 [Brachionus plicatilis]